MPELLPHQNYDPTRTAELADRITNTLNTPEFLRSVNTFDDEQRDAAVGAAVEFIALDLPPKNIGDYLTGLQKISQHENLAGTGYEAAQALQLDFISRKLTDQVNGSPASNEDVFNYINTHMIEQGHVYHGFNGSFRQSISENGLSPFERGWDYREAHTVHEIMQNVGHTNALGWLFVNSSDRLFLTESARPLYRYATGSPEWFNHFSSGAMPDRPPYDKHAFQKRDYDAASRNIDTLCVELMSRDEVAIAAGKSYPNLKPEDAETVKAFFDKHWQQFAGQDNQAMIALIPRAVIRRDHPRWESYAEFKESGLDLVQYMGFVAYDVDLRAKKTISPTEIAVAELPEYSHAHSQ